ncbi:unnamed protein product [Parascedosporium putredinis]|uniref:Cation/H+ exchanger transmembrane domain-containing protein n=1 Tax=Parascedosporium putredinis TaxID=1442378 RepID=A0A9P1H9I7_9PEZI|nr:unnamed protein product [Parascedosporium putredinis]CAI8003531.1 unnamed protein product [Parascedosporium putredinis]
MASRLAEAGWQLLSRQLDDDSDPGGTTLPNAYIYAKHPASPFIVTDLGDAAPGEEEEEERMEMDANFFQNIGVILTFAFAGTFLSAIVIGFLIWFFSLFPGTMDLSLVDAISVGATLSATDPVTILAIFNSYKVDPKLYTIIFGSRS